MTFSLIIYFSTYSYNLCLHPLGHLCCASSSIKTTHNHGTWRCFRDARRQSPSICFRQWTRSIRKTSVLLLQLHPQSEVCTQGWAQEKGYCYTYILVTQKVQLLCVFQTAKDMKIGICCIHTYMCTWHGKKRFFVFPLFRWPVGETITVPTLSYYVVVIQYCACM